MSVLVFQLNWKFYFEQFGLSRGTQKGVLKCILMPRIRIEKDCRFNKSVWAFVLCPDFLPFWREPGITKKICASFFCVSFGPPSFA
jgi:hypothetical protein